jgi:MYXO-CTERM domain-containing protein
MKSLPLFSLLALLCADVAAYAQVAIDFETPGAFTGNFRVVNSGTTFTQTTSGGNGYLSGGSATGTYVYDANGSASGISSFSVSMANPLTVTFDLSAAASNSSLGIYILNAGTDTAYLGLLNIVTGSGNDNLRFSNGTVTPSTNGSGTLVAGSYALNSANFIGTEASPTFADKATFVYSIDSLNQPVLAYTVNGTTSTYTLAGFTAFSNVEIGFRSNGGGAALRIDDIALSTVPEPSAWVLAAAGLGLLGLLRRRRG